jgi:hypothetical protein
MGRRALGELWRSEGLRYVSEVSAMVAALTRGEEWSGPEPLDTRGLDLANRVLELLHEANEHGDVDRFRAEFPPAHAPFVGSLRDRGTWIAQLVWFDHRRLAFVAGEPWTGLQGYELDVEHEVLTPLQDCRGLGADPSRRHFARASSAGIEVRRGPGGPQTAWIPWPDAWPRDDGTVGRLSACEQLLVSPSGDRVVLATAEGIFLATPSGARRVHPLPDPEDDEWEPFVDMVNAAMSPDAGCSASATSRACTGSWIPTARRSERSARRAITLITRCSAPTGPYSRCRRATSTRVRRSRRRPRSCGGS